MKSDSFVFTQSKGRHGPFGQGLSESHTLTPLLTLAAGAAWVFLAPRTLPAEESCTCPKALPGALFPSVTQAVTYLFRSYQECVLPLSI